MTSVHSERSSDWLLINELWLEFLAGKLRVLFGCSDDDVSQIKAELLQGLSVPEWKGSVGGSGCSVEDPDIALM